MAYQNVSGALFKRMVANGAINLKNNYQKVDELNVFPVPDGDTGTNMSMTIMSGINEIEGYESSSLSDISKVLSRGFLMGARGNSGVILSQYFRGLSLGMKNISGSSATIEEFVDTLISGNKIAYQAVMTPIEGTILTVMRESGEYIDLHRKEFKTIDQVLKAYYEKAQESLANTPNILQVLKDAHVVDSGGAGFVYIVEGMYLASIDKMLEMNDNENEAEKEIIEETQVDDSRFTYELSFDIMLKDASKFSVADLRSPLSIIGDSLAVNLDKDIVHVSLRTNNPGRALSMGQRHGEFKTVSLLNKKLPVEEKKEEPVADSEAEKYAIIAVCFGDGIKDSFIKLGAKYIIDGGQTMNPSTEAFVKAVQNINAQNIIIIPNNSNIIMSASQTKELCPDKNIEVLKTKNLVHGFVALASFDEEEDLETNIEAMNGAIQNCHSIEVTYAVRDTEINGVKIEKDDQMAILDDQIVASTKDRFKSIKKALTRCVNDDTLVITIFKGKDALDEEIEKMEEYVGIINPDCDFEIIEGGQDIYSYIISVE